MLRVGDRFYPLKARSLVSLVPIIAVSSVDIAALEASDNDSFCDRLKWFERQRPDLFDQATERDGSASHALLLSFLSRE